MLLDNYKFDLRVYVLVTSCDPLRIFVYEDGLVRLATTKYTDPTNNNVVSRNSLVNKVFAFINILLRF